MVNGLLSIHYEINRVGIWIPDKSINWMVNNLYSMVFLPFEYWTVQYSNGQVFRSWSGGNFMKQIEWGSGYQKNPLTEYQTV